ncbi:DinB family protein [Streptomyces zagrosensis]|uniref:Putative damage-inducible protein DinB n=1 Tax=Streptomyces zagrosensis TaxID=1042984 RepID=A0A7W9QAL3_9ACTN|nr:DinB family protein [Streptomyces zagrosensis]MBB5936670.1 putative damage-inducible protein DinB [Streptomyces zagrosensis]
MSLHVPIAHAAKARVIPAHQLSEKDMLWAFLEFARATVIAKVAGLGDQELRQPHVPSGISLGGILKHLVTGENHWFANVLGGRELPMPFSVNAPDGDWWLDAEEGPEQLVTSYQAACNTSNTVIASLPLDSTGKQRDSDYTLRWALCHLIAETNRHAGHADLLRELTDGARGW